MFGDASSFDQPIGNWDMSNVTDMSGMFDMAISFNQPIGAWNTSKVTTMSQMLARANSFNQDIGAWDVSSVTNTSYMFYDNYTFNNAGSDSIGSWNTHSIKTPRYMFWNAYAFNQSLASWDVTAFETYTSYNSGESMFQSSGVSRANYEADLVSWAAQSVNAGFWLGAEGRSYCDATLTRAGLINNHGWLITGDTICAPTISATDISQEMPITGTGAPGATVLLTVSGTTYTAVIAGDGTWSISTPSLLWPTGTVALSARDSDEALFSSPLATNDASGGNYSMSAMTNVNLVINPVAPPVIDIPPSGLLTNDPLPTIAGTGQKDAAITVKDDTNTTICSTVVDNAGLWSCVPGVALTDGQSTLTAVQTYTGASASHTSNVVTITVDTVAPVAPVITSPVEFSIVPDPLAPISGTGEIGALVTVKDDQAAVICTGTVAGGGTWSCVPNTALSDGSHSISAMQTDPAANMSIDSGVTIFAIGPITSTFDFSTLISPSGVGDSASQAKLSVTSSVCYTIDAHTPLSGEGIASPNENVDIVGGVHYDLSCVSSGGSSRATITLGSYYSDLSKLHMYKKMVNSSDMQDVTGQIELVNTTDTDGNNITTLSYTLTDGGAYDEDALANGTIVDPLYFGVTKDAALATTGTSWWLALFAGLALMTAGGFTIRRRSSR